MRSPRKATANRPSAEEGACYGKQKTQVLKKNSRCVQWVIIYPYDYDNAGVQTNVAIIIYLLHRIHILTPSGVDVKSQIFSLSTNALFVVGR